MILVLVLTRCTRGLLRQFSMHAYAARGVKCMRCIKYHDVRKTLPFAKDLNANWKFVSNANLTV